MQPPHEAIDKNFLAILASSVHDMKNSLASARNLLSRLAARCEGVAPQEWAQIEFETNRMNNSLMQLLTFYKIGQARFRPLIDECRVHDLLDDVVAQQGSLLACRDIGIALSCDDALYCYCDANLVGHALGTILNNATRYCKSQVQLSAVEQEGYVVLKIEDDGAGYPPALLNMLPPDPSGAIDFVKGSTGLGLYFAWVIAAMHENEGRQGRIAIHNGGELGGACFALYLP